MDDEKKQIKWLLLTAAFLCAAIILYNLFFLPKIELVSVVQTDLNSVQQSSAQEHKGNSGTFSAAERVNLNTATQEELDALPGIGPVLAQRIVEYRDANGPFTSPEDLKQISGIGDKIFENLKDNVTTG